jgi:hypothetical protein
MATEQDFVDTIALISRLDRRRREYRNVGWVYVLRNAQHRDGLLKVGKSSRYPTWRAAELTKATGVAGVFDPVYFVHVGDINAAEHHAHTILAPHRFERGKEFFKVPLRAAVEALDDAATMFPVMIRRKSDYVTIAQCFEERTISCSGCGQRNRYKPLYVDVYVRCSKCAQLLSL